MGFLKNFFGERVTWQDVESTLQKDSSQQVKKWITVYFSIYFKKHQNDQDVIEKTASDITSIINNTHSIFTENGDFLGCVNPYLQIDTIFSDSGVTRPFMKRDLDKIFKCSIEESPDQYHLVIHPVKENSNEIDLYPLETLCYDMYILGHASDYISNRYPITLHSSQSSFNPEMMNDVPSWKGSTHRRPFLFDE